jgi:hypothetical protein
MMIPFMQSPTSQRWSYFLHNTPAQCDDNVESHALWLRKRARINPASLVPKSVFIESFINSSNEEIQSSTSSIQQVPEFGKHRYEKGEVKVNLQSVFDGAF